MELSKTISDYILEKEKNGYVIKFKEDNPRQTEKAKYDFLSDCSDMDDVEFKVRREIIEYQDDTGIVLSNSIDENVLIFEIVGLIKEELNLPHALQELNNDIYYE